MWRYDTVQPGAISELGNVVQRQLETNLESQAAPLVGGARPLRHNEQGQFRFK